MNLIKDCDPGLHITSMCFCLFFFFYSSSHSHPSMHASVFPQSSLYKGTNNATLDSFLIILLTMDSLNMPISFTIKKLIIVVLEMNL